MADTRYFTGRWTESPGGDKAHWGCSSWYFEVDSHGVVTRQIEVYDSGPRLRYDSSHSEDAFGALAKVWNGETEAQLVPITSSEFEAEWSFGPWSNEEE